MEAGVMTFVTHCTYCLLTFLLAGPERLDSASTKDISRHLLNEIDRNMLGESPPARRDRPHAIRHGSQPATVSRVSFAQQIFEEKHTLSKCYIQYKTECCDENQLHDVDDLAQSTLKTITALRWHNLETLLYPCNLLDALSSH